MLIFGPYIVSKNNTTFIPGLGGYPDTRAIVVMNESPYMLRITVNGVGVWGIPAQTADICDVGSSFSGSLEIDCVDYLLTSMNAPSYVVYIQTIGVQDSLYRSLQRGGVTGYPLTLPRLQSIGNAVNTNSVSNTLQNDGNPSGTNIIESTPATASGSTIFINNDGTVIIKGFNASVLTTLLQLVPSAGGGASSVLLSDSTRQTEVLGNLKVDGTSFLGSIQNSVTPVTINGITSGSISVYQTWTGTDKRVIIELNGWTTPNGTTQTIVLPTAFVARSNWNVWAIGNNKVEALSSGTPVSFRVLTTLALGGGTSQPQAYCTSNSIAQCTGGFDTIRFTGDGTSITSQTIIEGR